MRTLFDETTLNGMVLKNRLVRSATWEGMAAPDGRPTARLAAYYATLAQGGVGLIITGYAYHPSRREAASGADGDPFRRLLPGPAASRRCRPPRGRETLSPARPLRRAGLHDVGRAAAPGAVGGESRPVPGTPRGADGSGYSGADRTSSARAPGGPGNAVSTPSRSMPPTATSSTSFSLRSPTGAPTVGGRRGETVPLSPGGATAASGPMSAPIFPVWSS